MAIQQSVRWCMIILEVNNNRGTKLAEAIDEGKRMFTTNLAKGVGLVQNVPIENVSDNMSAQ